MKRTLALLLAALLTLSAALPVLAEEGARAPAERAASSVGTETGKAAPPAAETGGVAAAPDASSPGQPGDGGSLAPADVLTANSVQSAPLAAENTADTVHFENLRRALEKYNYTVLALQGQIKDVTNTTVSLDGGIDGLQQMATGVRNAMNAITTNPLTAPPPAEKADVYLALSASLGLLEIQITQMMGSRNTVYDSTESAKNSLNDGINQLIRGAETLYVALVAMEDGMSAMNRGLESLNRAVAIVEKQRELGLASPYDVEKIHHQRDQLQSQMESLKFQIASNKVTLEGMCGMALKGTVYLAELPMPTQAELDAVNYDKTLNTAMNRNVDVMNAEISYNANNSGANKNALNGAKSNFTAKFKAVCMAIPENVRLVDAARETADFQQRTFDIAAKKYELGMASHEEYLAAKGELDGAKDDLRAAQRNLFSAYRAYVNATQYGLV